MSTRKTLFKKWLHDQGLTARRPRSHNRSAGAHTTRSPQGRNIRAQRAASVPPSTEAAGAQASQSPVNRQDRLVGAQQRQSMPQNQVLENSNQSRNRAQNQARNGGQQQALRASEGPASNLQQRQNRGVLVAVHNCERLGFMSQQVSDDQEENKGSASQEEQKANEGNPPDAHTDELRRRDQVNRQLRQPDQLSQRAFGQLGVVRALQMSDQQIWEAQQANRQLRRPDQLSQRPVQQRMLAIEDIGEEQVAQAQTAGQSDAEPSETSRNRGRQLNIQPHIRDLYVPERDRLQPSNEALNTQLNAHRVRLMPPSVSATSANEVPADEGEADPQNEVPLTQLNQEELEALRGLMAEPDFKSEKYNIYRYTAQSRIQVLWPRN